MTFLELKLIQPLLDALKTQAYDKPTPIQAKAIPAILAGRDVMAAAQTGTGKTAGFTLPLLQQLAKMPKPQANSAQALVLVPTRELAIQVAKSVEIYAQNLKLSCVVAYGGVKINPQMLKMRKGTNILVATPGRLLDLMERNSVKLGQCHRLILDEADRMLDMGFMPAIKRIVKQLPSERQTLMFSATFSASIKKLAGGFLTDPVNIEVSPANTTVEKIDQMIYPVDKKRKAKLLSYLIGHHQWRQLLVFVRTRRGANKLTFDLRKDGISATTIHGDKSQGARNRALADFKSGEAKVLVATDVAARGIDIPQLPLVVNHDLPNVAEDYVHRIGRTGRAGESGLAISLVSADEADHLRDVQNLIGQELKRTLADGFEPINSLPDTPLRVVAKKKPHKKKMARAQQNDKSGQAKNSRRKRPRPNRKPSGGSANSGATSNRGPAKKASE